MISKLSIRNFKSLKELDIDCARVNLFIGEPNTGKSNILEALGVLSWCGYRGKNLNEFGRFKNLRQLFYEGQINQSIQIDIDGALEIGYNQTTSITPLNKNYHITNQLIEADSSMADPNKKFGAELRPDGQVLAYHGPEIDRKYNFIRFYRFKAIDIFPDAELFFLEPPCGSNLVSLISVSEKIRETISQLSNDFGLKIIIREDEDTIEFVKQLSNIISFSYPYITVSDTLLRMIFYNVAIDSNENSTLIFEEPEVHAFPAYIKQLGEKIAFDETNQYFIVTHNPYLFLSIAEKTPKNDLNVFATYMKDYQTKVKRASNEQISDLMDYDPFFNLGQIIEEDDNDSN
jgi:hypothetical protein